MSSSNAAAIRRRATPAQTNPPPLPKPSDTSAKSVSQPMQGLTLQQVISTFDKRIKDLESSTKPEQFSITNTLDAMQLDNLPSIMQEFNSRFEMIAEEISSMKDVIMKLQSFTMEVNKSMYDERIHILSDLGNSVSGSTVDNRDHTAQFAPVHPPRGSDSPTSIDLKSLAESELASQNA